MLRFLINGPLMSVLVAFLMAHAPVSFAESRWSPIKEQGGVQVFSRFSGDRTFREYRGEIEVEAKPDRVVRLLQDLSALPEWHYSLESATLLKTLGFTDALVHIVIAPPWPLKKRDVVCKVSLKLEEENDAIRITLVDVPDELAVDPAYQRVPSLQAEWLIQPASDNSSLVRYTTYTNPGGNIPTWFYNNVAMDVPLFTLLNLRRHFADNAD